MTNQPEPTTTTGRINGCIGPFLCEWCDTPMTKLRGTKPDDDDASKIVAVGWCPKCNCELWSQPVAKEPT